MGFLDSIFGKEEPEPLESGSEKPFKVSLSFLPLRLSANKKNSVNLIVKVTNPSKKEKLVSVDALLPSNSLLGFDKMCINKSIEKRTGTLKGGETREINIEIWANSQTDRGDYPVEVRVYSHYLDYKKVINYLKKKTTLRVA